MSRLLGIIAVVLFVAPLHAQQDRTRWEQQAKNVSITRDDWGIAHVRGKTDADAVFGMIYAQAEDDFNRVETNFLNGMGRLAEAEGESAIYRDLRMKLFINPDTLKAIYARSPVWLKSLMNAWADGLNFYLATHPQTKPRVLTRFEPWMALSFSEGSIGGDMERANLGELAAFYGKQPLRTSSVDDGYPQEPSGSNGIAIAPKNTVNGRTLFLINPHTSFFFRSELQMTSDEGLNAYGAATWGQFFIYQGFNDRLGWMHTSSGVDAIDEYAETIVDHNGRKFYKYGDRERPVITSTITVPYKTATGLTSRQFTVYHTHHGPIVRETDGKWIAVRLMNDPMRALQQSYLRMKAKNYKAFRELMEMHTNSSNNTIYADADGNIAYFHANFVPRRKADLDWTKPVNGADPATEWGPLWGVEESPFVLNPGTGWLYNSNNWPYSAAGPDSPKRESFPKYVDVGTESYRGMHAIRVLENRKDFTIDKLLGAAFDSYQPGFAEQIPPLVAAYDALPASDSLKTQLRDQIAVLRKWDYRWSASSVANTLAVYWGTRRLRDKSEDQVVALANASNTIAADFGTWRTAWGDVNRFQRINADITQQFNDAAPSIPVPFSSANWGSLASFGARPYPGTKKFYGTSGNSFVAAVEFGQDSVRARAVTAGGESGDVRSIHFIDQASRYAEGNLRPVYFYENELKNHSERSYRPGE